MDGVLILATRVLSQLCLSDVDTPKCPPTPSLCEFIESKLLSEGKGKSRRPEMPRLTRTIDGVLLSKDILRECLVTMSTPPRESSLVNGIKLNQIPQLPPLYELPPAWVKERFDKLDEFCLPHVKLSDKEKQVILEVGVQHHLMVPNKASSGIPLVGISSDMLRQLGHDVTRMRVLQQLMFGDMTFLTLGELDIANAVEIFDNNKLVCEFMKKHHLYEAVYPFRKFHHSRRDRVAKEISLVMSFHTMMGLFAYKNILDETHSEAGSLAEKVILGPKGLIRLALDGVL